MTRISHLDLLQAARAVQQASVDDDHAALHLELRRLRSTLVEHLRAEEDAHDHLPGSTQEIIRQGQQGLLDLVDDLLSSTAHRDRTCACLSRAAELQRRLARQARLEATLLRAPPS